VSTYTPIATITVTNSTTNAIDFTGIPQNYTDLVVVGSFFTGNSSLGVRLGNGSFDTGNNYSNTVLRADSTGAATNRGTNGSLVDVGNGYADQGATIILNFHNYSSTTTNKTFLGRWTGKWSAGGTYVNATANLWRSTSAINQIRLYNYAGSTVYFTNGATFSLYGIDAQASAQAKATGGNSITTDGTYWYHTFRSSGTFTPTRALTCDYLVVAGGGSGAKQVGGGGGAGGVRCTVGATGGGGSLESALSLTAQAYTVTVGAGAAAGGGTLAAGSNSVFGSITAIGGGSGNEAGNGQTGGSGSGGSGGTTVTRTGGAGTANQGYAGGTQTRTSGDAQYAAGGGGAGAVGGSVSNPGSSTGGNGGNGIATSISGTSTSYGGGGGGGVNDDTSRTPGTGGTGGGGTGGSSSTSNQGTAGTANTGGGGGGGGGGNTNGAAGGSGIVIVRYAV